MIDNVSKISIIMGIYNCAKTLPEAIDSILAQTYTNWELIMCDDASTDNTYEIAKRYADKYPDKIVLIQNEINSRLAYSLNHCLKYATGEYIARMDGDDISAPERLEKQLNYLQRHQDIHLVGTAMQQFDKEYKNIRLVKKPEHIRDKYILHSMNPFNHATILTYKYVFDVLGGYTVAERTTRCEDYDLWFRFLSKGFLGDNINEPLYHVREDINAIKRRTFKSRWQVWETTKYGYRLLGYPKYWLFESFIIILFKSIIPARLQFIFRKVQQKRNNK